MRGGPASHIDQGRRSRFPARVLLRPDIIDHVSRKKHYHAPHEIYRGPSIPHATLLLYNMTSCYGYFG